MNIYFIRHKPCDSNMFLIFYKDNFCRESHLNYRWQGRFDRASHLGF